MENDNTIAKPDRDPTQMPAVRREFLWALAWFAALIAVRVLSVPLAEKLGLDESQQYLVVRPIEFASNWALLAAGFVAFVKFVFPNTLGRDMGTRFNQAWNSIENPRDLLWMYIAIGASLLVSMSLLLGMN